MIKLMSVSCRLSAIKLNVECYKVGYMLRPKDRC